LISSHSAARAGGEPRARPQNNVVLVAANSSFALTNYRLGLLNALQTAGYRVVAAVPDDEGASKLEANGVDVRTVPIAPHGTSPVHELRLLYRYVELLRELRPRALLGFTIKPNIYGALAARIARVPVINNVTGLGLVFTRRGPLRWIVGALYKIAFRKSYRIFFQNRESRDLFLVLGFVQEDQALLLPGSGIDLKRFAPGAARKADEAQFIFLLPSRLMWQKGIAEYCEAARWFHSNRSGLRFQLLGAIEPVWNKAAIPKEQVKRWEQEGIEYLGSTDDVRPFFEAADCIVLPSYYPEGVPRALIEAAAMGKPVITTDTPGCRDVVDPGRTGYICEPRSAASLASAMKKMTEHSPGDRSAMGKRAREKAEREFDERLVIDAYLAEIAAIASR
jgi:glycosyltransferase involved in cell wall biosynthesis